MSATFYRAFEDRYRGSRDVIKQRLAAYAPFLRPLAALDHGGAPGRALDLGCGRGEWLELLGECGLAGRGVDLDEGMLAACRERHLDVELADALGSLRALPDASLALVSAFHLVEHLPFEMVQDIIAEAHRVLRPGGLLILETPNPENLSVGASSFYLDPTHERPLPPALLDFAVDFGGFARHTVVRLQEDAALHTDAPIGLITVLEGASPDYGVVAQKQAGAAVLARFDAPFGADYGIAVGALAQRYDRQQHDEHAKLHVALGHALTSLDTAHRGLAALDTRQHALAAQQTEQAQAQAAQHDTLAALAAHVDALHASHQQQLADLAQERARQAQHIADLLSSSSWRVTAPLRWSSTQLRRVRLGLRGRAKGLLLAGMRAVLRQPRLKRLALRLLRRVPSLHARLYGMMAWHAAPPAPLRPHDEALDELSPRAQRAYQELKLAQESRKH